MKTSPMKIPDRVCKGMGVTGSGCGVRAIGVLVRFVVLGGRGDGLLNFSTSLGMMIGRRP